MANNGLIGPVARAAADLAKALVKAKAIKPAVGALAVLLSLLSAFEASVLSQLPEQVFCFIMAIVLGIAGTASIVMFLLARDK